MSPVSALEEDDEPATLRQALAQTSLPLKAEIVTLPQTSTTGSLKATGTTAGVAHKQSFIWVGIILAVVLFFSVLALLGLDEGKDKDTILYAKFLRVEDGAIRN